MEKKDVKLVKGIIKEKGDSFWNDNPFNNDDGGNEVLFDEIIEMLNEAGYDLVLVQK
jgi:hypothetical protein